MFHDDTDLTKSNITTYSQDVGRLGRAFQVTNVYILALLAIAIFSLFAFLLLKESIHSHEKFIKLMNVNSSQQVEIQKLAVFSRKLDILPAAEREKLLPRIRSSLEKLRQNHEYFRYSIKTFEPNIQTELKKFYQKKPHVLDAKTQAYITKIEALIAYTEKGVTSPRVEKLKDDIILSSGRDFESLSALYLYIQTSNETKLSKLESIENFVFVTTILLLLLEAFAIFRPMAQRIQQNANQLIVLFREIHSIIMALPDHYFKTDPEGMIEDFKLSNSQNSFPAETEKDIFSVLGMNEKITEQCRGLVKKVLETRNMEVFEFKTKSLGEIRYLEGRIVFETPDRVAFLIRDYTDRVKVEKELKEKERESHQSAKMAALGEMASGVSHGINNPLSIITGRLEEIAEDLREKGDLTDDIQNNVDSINNMVFRIKKIINGMRSFARDDSQDSPKKVDVVDLIETSLTLCEQRLKLANIQIRKVRVLRGINFTLCRQNQIEQVLINLIINAADAIEHLDEKWIEIEVRGLQSLVEIIVTDSGRGIPRDNVDKIMNPFFSTKETEHGIGLGLSISKGIIEAHHGRLFVNERAENTCLIVSLPRIEQESDVRAGESDQGDSNQGDSNQGEAA